MRQVDALVIGSGPAGSTTAALLARRGWETLLIDKARFPRQKTCGEGMMPAGVRHLRSLGLEDEALARGAAPFYGVRFFLPSGPPLTLDFRELGSDLYGLIWPRRDMDGLLVDFARRQGVMVLERTRAVDIDLAAEGCSARLAGDGLPESEDQRVHSRLLVGADGAFSSLHRILGCCRESSRPHRFAMSRCYDNVSGLESFVDVFFAAVGEAYVAPLGPTTARVTLMTDSASGGEPAVRRYRTLLSGFPRLSPRLNSAHPDGPIGAASSLARTISRPLQGAVLLVGDAAGSADPITGQGLSLALQDATTAGIAGHLFLLGSHSALPDYWEARRRVFDPAFTLAERLLNLLHRPKVAQRAFRLLASDECLRRRVLALAVSLPPGAGLGPIDRLRLVVGF